MVLNTFCILITMEFEAKIWSKLNALKHPPIGLGCCSFLGDGSVVVDLVYAPNVRGSSMFSPFLLFSTFCLSSITLILIRKREQVALV